MVKIVFGGAIFYGSDKNFGMSDFGTPEQVEKVLGGIEKLGIKNIDTAQLYGESERLLGETDAAKRFVIDTKLKGGFGPEVSTKDVVIKTGHESLQKLKTKQVDILYIHAPDRRVPVSETLAGIDALHKAGVFKRFGLSNFKAEEVEEVIRIAKEKKYVLPTVYQGNFSAVARRQEKELFPILRKNKIAFYAYSPVAGGFLTKTPEQIKQGGTGRWDPNSHIGKLYHGLYNKPDMIKALQLWGDLSKSSGLSKAELAYRWVSHNSILKDEHGDAVIIGAKNLEQVTDTVAALKKGPLSPEIVKKIDEIWAIVEKDSPLDNFNTSTASQQM